MIRLLSCLLLFGCAANEPLSLKQRFEEVAFHEDSGPTSNTLWKWTWPMRAQIVGSREYDDLVADHLAELGELTGLEIEFDSSRPNVVIEFSTRRKDVWCDYALIGSARSYRAEIFIATDQPARQIRRCVSQELSQILGLIDDTDGRTDTAFSSGIGTDHLTTADRQLFRILYDPRLRGGMPRDQVLAVLPEIVADIEAELR